MTASGTEARARVETRGTATNPLHPRRRTATPSSPQPEERSRMEGWSQTPRALTCGCHQGFKSWQHRGTRGYRRSPHGWDVPHWAQFPHALGVEGVWKPPQLSEPRNCGHISSARPAVGHTFFLSQLPTKHDIATSCS